jgi:phosphoserine phosphatase RsbU/P
LKENFSPLGVDFLLAASTFLQRRKEMSNDAMVVDVSQDWATACDVQHRFMGATVSAPDGLSYAAHCRQLRALGGDSFEFLPMAGNRLAVVVADASGKSLAAALMIANVMSSLRTAALFAGTDLSAIVEAVNRQVYSSSLADRYATLFYGVYDPATRTLRYVNAGHNPPVVLRPDGSTLWLEAGGPPVGLFSDSLYEEGCVQLSPGDRVLAYTDGITEAASPDGQEWSVEGLLHAVRRSSADMPEDVVHAIFAAMDAFSRECQTDDATLAVLRVD